MKNKSYQYDALRSRGDRLKSMSTPKIPSYAYPPGRDGLRDAPSLPMTMDTIPSKQNEYTGDAMIGIATLHKSNAVPVFSQEEAVDISKMRRG